MARLTVAACCSHAPAIVREEEHQNDPWRRFNSAYRQLKGLIQERNPDVMIVVYDDHFDNFFLNAWPTFALGASETYGVADEGGADYWRDPIPGHPAASAVLSEGLIRAGFDLTLCYGDMVLDHGATVPLPRLTDGKMPNVVPLVVNCVSPPTPSAARCWSLGSAIRSVMDNWDEDVTYGVLGTGGLSHQLGGPDFGAMYPDFDREFLDILTGPNRSLVSELSESDLRRGGAGALETANWVVVAGAVGEEAAAQVLAYEPLESAMTGMAVLHYEVDASKQLQQSVSIGART